MKKLIVIFLVCVLTASASQGTVISFDENGNGEIGMATAKIPLQHGMDLTLFYVLPSPVIAGDVVIYEPGTSFQVISDVLRFFNVEGTPVGRVYVFSETEAGEINPELADVGIPADLLSVKLIFEETGAENGWNGLMNYTPTENEPGYMNADYSVTYNFTSDVPEPATICLLGFGVLGLIRHRK